MTITNYGGLHIVNTSTAGNQYDATAAGLTTGKIIVTWYDQNLNQIHAQYYDALGNTIGSEFGFDFPSFAPNQTGESLPRVAADAFGGYIIGFVGQGANSTTRDGAAEFDPNDQELSISFSGLTSTSHNFDVGKSFGATPGNIVRAFQDGSSDAGDILGSLDVTTQKAGLQTWPDLAFFPGEQHFVVSWWDDQTKLVKARIFNTSDDSPVTGELTAGSVGSASGTAFHYRGDALAALTGGNFVVVWESFVASATDTSGYGIQASVFNSSGTLLKNSFQINSTFSGSQEFPSVVGLLDGGFAVAWTDFSAGPQGTVVLRTFDASGSPTSSEYHVDGAGHNDYAPQLTLLADGRLAVTWEADNSAGGDTSGNHTEMQIVDTRTGPATLTAAALGSDFVGTAFNDQFTSGAGNDRFTGGAGFDTAIFPHVRSAYTITHSGNSLIVSGPDGTDTLTGIEKLIFRGVGFIVSPRPDDFDGSGTSDALLRNKADGSLWLNTYNGTTITGGGPAGSPTTDWDAVGTGDFNNDGHTDVALRNHASGQLWFNFYNGASIVSSGPGGSPTTDWDVAGVGDFNGDGFGDIMLRNHASGSLWINLYNGVNIIGSGPAGSPTTDWDVAGIGDFNRDGTSDVLLHNHNTGQLYINLYNGVNMVGSGSAGGPTTDWDVGGIGDFNGDGYSDVLLHNRNTGQLWINLYNGLSMAGSGPAGSPTTDWDVARVADYNNDGFADVMLRNHNDGSLYLNLYQGLTPVGSGPAGTPSLDWQFISV
jgi:hypothetical protein